MDVSLMLMQVRFNTHTHTRCSSDRL